MFRRLKTVLLIALVGTTLAGCAELNSIHRTSSTPTAGKGKIVTVDAKQRHLLMMPETLSGSVTNWRVCAEAAPDVFSAFATSVGARGDKSGGEFSLASAETAATIERTQTINMLRESFYRTCERYASGAITKTQFVIQAARDQRSMVAILAIEQLTGAVRPKSTIISGPLTSASTISGADAAEIVKDYNTRLKAAEASYKQAQTGFAEAKEEGGACAEGEKKDAVACAALEAAEGSAKADRDKAQAGLDNAIKLAKDLVSSTAASAGGSANSQGGGITQSDISEANLAAVASAVVNIQLNANIDETLMFCIGYLTDPDNSRIAAAAGRTPGTDYLIVSQCLDRLKDQQLIDSQIKSSILKGTIITPLRGAQEDRLAKYLDPSLGQTELKRRMDNLRQAARRLNLDDSPAAILKVLVEGPEDLRQRVIAEVATIELNADALNDLN